MAENKRWVIAVAFAAVLLVAALVLAAPPSPEVTPHPTPTVEVGFANPQLLVETDWLAEHLKDADLRIVDARKAEDYQAGHIPGAISIPRPTTFDPEAPKGIIGQPEQVAELFGGKGIDEKVHIVVYDEGKNTAASRVFWTLEYYGHPNVSALNGGFTKWQIEGRELSTEEPEVTPVTFTAKTDSSKLSNKEQILEDIGKAGVVVLDARSPEEYQGEDVRTKRGGHIPGAVNIDWVENFTAGEVPVFKSAAELTQLYEEAGVTGDKLVYAY